MIKFLRECWAINVNDMKTVASFFNGFSRSTKTKAAESKTIKEMMNDDIIEPNQMLNPKQVLEINEILNSIK